jgi:hypothetical protein
MLVHELRAERPTPILVFHFGLSIAILRVEAPTSVERLSYIAVTPRAKNSQSGAVGWLGRAVAGGIWRNEARITSNAVMCSVKRCPLKLVLTRLLSCNQSVRLLCRHACRSRSSNMSTKA